jgi:NadR type nicotinamide-nucleotide adenylyltransferase
MEKISGAKTIKRIALTGPESTGKTTLCMQLAEHYKTVWVPEYARLFMHKLKREYNYDDVVHCARVQMKSEDEMMEQANQLLFCDTELINYKIWFDDKFQKVPDWLEGEIEKRKFDLYLLTSPDLPWVDESVRENPERGKYFFDLYLGELEKRNFPFRIISGTGDSRSTIAINLIDAF